MYTSQERAHIAQARRNPTIKRYTENSVESREETHAMDIDLTKRLSAVADEHVNSGANFFDEESNFDDYASETSGSSFSSTASLVDQLGGTFDEPELLVTSAASASPPPPTPVILAKAPKPVGVFSIADFMKNVQAAPVRASRAPSLPPQPEDLSQKRSSAYSQSSKEPMTSVDPHEEENTWESGNNATNIDDMGHDDNSSGFPPLDSSDNSVLSDPPDYDQNYDRSFEEEEKYQEDQVYEQEHQSMAEMKYDQLAAASSPAPSVVSSATPSVFSQVNPLFARRPRDEVPLLQPPASDIQHISGGRNYDADNAKNRAGSQLSLLAVEPTLSPAAAAATPAPKTAYATALATASIPRSSTSDILVSGSIASAAPAKRDKHAVEKEAETEVPPPPPSIPVYDIARDRIAAYNTALSEVIDVSTPFMSQKLPAQLQFDAIEDFDNDNTGMVDIIPPAAVSKPAAVKDTDEQATKGRKVSSSYADEYSTLGTYSHYFHTPVSPLVTPMTIAPEKPVLPVEPVVPAVPPPAAAVLGVPSNVTTMTEQVRVPIESTPSAVTPSAAGGADRNEITGHSVPTAVKVNNSINSSPAENVSESLDLTLTTTSSRYRGRFLSPDKVRACLLAATATPAMSSPVPDSGRVDKNRNKKQLTSGSVAESAKDTAKVEKHTPVVDTNSAILGMNATAAGTELSASSVKPGHHNNYLNTTDTANSLYSNYETHSFSSSIRALNDSELLLQYKTSLLLQSQLIDKVCISQLIFQIVRFFSLINELVMLDSTSKKCVAGFPGC